MPLDEKQNAYMRSIRLRWNSNTSHLCRTYLILLLISKTSDSLKGTSSQTAPGWAVEESVRERTRDPCEVVVDTGAEAARDARRRGDARGDIELAVSRSGRKELRLRARKNDAARC